MSANLCRLLSVLENVIPWAVRAVRGNVVTGRKAAAWGRKKSRDAAPMAAPVDGMVVERYGRVDVDL